MTYEYRHVVINRKLFLQGLNNFAAEGWVADMILPATEGTEAAVLLRREAEEPTPVRVTEGAE